MTEILKHQYFNSFFGLLNKPQVNEISKKGGTDPTCLSGARVGLLYWRGKRPSPTLTSLTASPTSKQADRVVRGEIRSRSPSSILIINKSPFWVGILAENEYILRVSIAFCREDVLKNLGLRNKISNNPSSLLQRLKKDLIAYLEGKKVDFSSYSLQFKGFSPLAKKVLVQLKYISYGQTRSYGWVAKKTGTRGYRAVGRILSKNPFSIILPCHRVIRKDGAIAGLYPSRKIREKLLQIEGYFPPVSPCLFKLN